MYSTALLIEQLSLCEVPPSDLIVSLLQDDQYASHPVVIDLVVHRAWIIEALAGHDPTNQPLRWSQKMVQNACQSELQTLSTKENQWHFNASNASAEQIEQFCLKDMALQFQSSAPLLWDLLESLLSANSCPTDPDLENPATEDANVVALNKLEEEY
ncbi:hypothetical protein SERLA73DRAFT_79518 [Serpula lacrymans var. lacrymans S7.3]|uniref:Uncharacterized protein n=1 Tax=Serpula lacrymans var. lacrymans (strain S7.3) TaxID=936435 RepID=F8QGP6_SERL3|nr:hypothetical protein SERLA73DRAFT_79518 [Serpula lacrymans var. lacrymans S7.3]